MRIVKKDQDKLKKEEAEKEKKASEEIRRLTFIDSLKENNRFQQYVIEEMLTKEIDSLSDMRKFSEQAISSASPEEAHRIMLANLKAVKILEKIKGKLT